MHSVSSISWPKLRALQIYGANTGVGKTIFASILCRAFQKRFPKVHYLKPVSTGPLNEADDRHISSFGSQIQSRCLYQYGEPVSPHIAARASPVTDAVLAKAIYDELASYATGSDAGVIVETAGGVLSPAPSGKSQADVYRPLRMPVFLVGDHQLGGIGTTISAWESLHIRGYDVESIALFAEDRYDNHSYLKEYFAERNVNTFSIPPPPERNPDEREDQRAMQKYYEQSAEHKNVQTFTEKFIHNHDARFTALRNMPQAADEAIWHPFMQHRERSKDTIVAMDSAYGDFFQTYTTKQDASPQQPQQSEPALLKPAFDGSASWWTQGLGHGNPALALTAAHAAGRYGHVMFASAVHEPALKLAQTLISRMGNPRLSKVFYSDNGSTGVEVAVKMALRATALREKWGMGEEVLILGFKNSYHGDTIGTMDCSEPSIYNEKVEWYRGRGHWLDFPQVKMREGKWVVEVPEELEEAFGESSKTKTRTFASLDDVFAWENRKEDEKLYRKYFDAELSRLRSEGKRLGALIMEPIILGAGGMMLADPLYQRTLVEAIRNTQPNQGGNHDPLDWAGMPIIFDEVFTGLYRLGRFSAADFLQVHPDIVVNAKLLTGGLLPLCTTTASQAVFDAFLSDDKSDALLHGHSYTAHAVGCAVANESLSAMGRLDEGEDWAEFRRGWAGSDSSSASSPSTSTASSPTEVSSGRAWSMWSQTFISSVSHKPNVDSVFALGSVLAMSLKDPAGGSGYASTAATGLRDDLLAGVEKEEGWVIHSRVLGNVLYLMTAMTTTPETVRAIEGRVLAALGN